MQIELVLFSEASGPALMPFELKAVASCAQVGFKLHLHGADWIASYIEMMLGMAADPAHQQAAMRAATDVRDSLRLMLQSDCPPEDLALPVRLTIVVPDWGAFQRAESPVAATAAASSIAA
jgi:hypothetical protein